MGPFALLDAGILSHHRAGRQADPGEGRQPHVGIGGLGASAPCGGCSCRQSPGQLLEREGREGCLRSGNVPGHLQPVWAQEIHAGRPQGPAAARAPVQLVQSGVRLAEGAEVGPPQQGLGARKAGRSPAGPALVPGTAWHSPLPLPSHCPAASPAASAPSSWGLERPQACGRLCTATTARGAGRSTLEPRGQEEPRTLAAPSCEAKTLGAEERGTGCWPRGPTPLGSAKSAPPAAAELPRLPLPL